MKYSVRTRSAAAFLFPLGAIIAAYVLPLGNWVQTALLGIAVGVVAGFAGRNFVVRSFDPADAPWTRKRQIVVGFSLARLVFGFAMITMGAVMFAWAIGAAIIALGGYLAGTTAATPLRQRDFEQLGGE